MKKLFEKIGTMSTFLIAMAGFLLTVVGVGIGFMPMMWTGIGVLGILIIVGVYFILQSFKKK